MKTGFIILNYNSAELTEKIANQVKEYNCVDYVIIVDNASTDQSAEQLKKLESSKVLLHICEKNGGYSYGNNAGAKLCEKLGIDIIFIANPDVSVEEKDILLILDAFEKTNYSLLTGVQYEIDGQRSNPPIFELNSYGRDIAECFFIGRRVFLKNKHTAIDYTRKVQPIRMFKGSFFGVRLSDFLEVGGFDEQVFLYCEERILSKRLLDQKKKIGLVTAARFDHMHSKSISKDYKSATGRMKLLYDSKWYYNLKYNKINLMQRIVLKLAMKVSLLEFTIKDYFHR